MPVVLAPAGMGAPIRAPMSGRAIVSTLFGPEDRDPLFGERPQVFDAARGQGVEDAGRFVGEDQLGVDRRRGGDRIGRRIMASLTIPITVEQIRELARQLSPGERQTLLDGLLAERFDAVLADADQGRGGGQASPSDAEIQAEVDAVREERREGRRGAAGR